MVAGALAAAAAATAACLAVDGVAVPTDVGLVASFLPVGSWSPEKVGRCG